jgi:alkanesulfonate monooxygenase SsuD/methylene tetrahydromethanopterin reductase-like flavin-dependent oxidoreductase (luciferase family)
VVGRARKTQVGVALPQYQIDVVGGAILPAMHRAARQAEAAGLDAVWLSDHPFAVGPDGVASGALEPLVAAAGLVRTVPQIDVGTLVLAATMRAPALVAHAARAIGPAFVLGLGAGWYEPEHRAFGIALPPYDERLARAEEVLDALGATRPRVLVGGSGPRVLDLAARRADVWNVAWDLPPDAFASLGRRVDEACARAERDPATLARSVGLTVLVAEDGRGLDRSVDRLRARAGFLRDLDRRELSARIVCGTPETCAEKLAAYGADEIVAALLLRDDPEMLGLFAERVVPLVRR